MKKRIKIFETGMYPQGIFNKERVKNIFGNIKDNVQGIFSHTSQWTEDKEAVELGDFSNIEIVDKGHKSEVYADVNFNEKGQGYYEDGILKGVSVEIPDGKLTRVAILPVGIQPAIAGAEFSKQPILFEFSEITEVNPSKKEKGEDNKMDRKEVLDTLTKPEIEAQAERLNITVAERLKPKTPEELEQEITARITKEAGDKAKVQEFMKEHDKKIVPAFKPFFEKIVEESLKSEVNWEFNKKDTSLYDGLQEFMKKMPEFSGFKNYSENIEFDDQTDGKDESEEAMRKAYEDTKKRYGGN